MQSQIEYELDVLKSGNYDHALQFIEHLVNILVRMSNALTDNEKVTNRVPQQKDDYFWGYTFNFIAKVVDFELDAMYAVTYRNNQLTLLFNPKEIENNYTVKTMLEGLRHEGYHLLFNHLNIHKNLDNYMSNLAADCEINQHLEEPHKHWISREYIAELCNMPEHTVKEKAGSLYYYELLNQKMPPEKRKKPKDSNQNKLRALTKFRKFRKEIPEFQKAVSEKLKTYDLAPTTIEKTMSPAQLYKANNPLWVRGCSIGTIKSIFVLENKLGKDVVIAKYIDEFV